MKSNSLTVRAPGLDALATVLKNYYKECSEVVSQRGDSRLILAQKYDFGNNSHTLGVVHIETTGERRFLVNIYAGGGRSGLFGIDHGAEDQLVEEMQKILLTAGEAIASDGDKEKLEADIAKAQKYNPYTQPGRKKVR
jgi:hypothetical protein